MKKPLALIIEDDLSSAKLYQRLFRIAGYKSRLCTTYDQAKKELEEIVPDLVVLDMRLEHYDYGPELLKYIKANDEFCDTRIVMITAYSKMADEYGDQADLVILKPVNARNLLLIAEDFQSVN